MHHFDPPICTPTMPTVRHWLGEADELAISCAREVLGPEGVGETTAILGVRLAACTIWRTTDGAPCWSKLDVEALCDDLTSNHLDADTFDLVIAVVTTFYGFLRDHAYLGKDEAQRIIGQLDPHIQLAVARLAAEDAATPDDASLFDLPVPRRPPAASLPN